jgi:hypothetical protein
MEIMKNKIIIIILFSMVFNLSANDINYQVLFLIIENINIDFSHFPTISRWNRTPCTPILDTPSKINYRTIITEESKKEPNFDGKYRIVEFGYGSGAQYFFIIDLNNGNVYEGIPSTHGIKYTNDSSLIIINDPDVILGNWNSWGEDIPNWVIIEYILWEDNMFKKLLIVNPLLD